MSESSTVAQVAELLLALEAELRRLSLWSDEPPAPEALASTTPFCYDTLGLEQWLQWVLLPKMKAILEAGQPLPARSGIVPLAEEYFPAINVDAARLLEIIAQFDAVISALGESRASH